MSAGLKISQSPLRPLIDELIVKGLSPKNIAHHLVLTKQSEAFSENTIADYRSNYFGAPGSPMMSIAKMAQDLTDEEISLGDGGDALTVHFTFQSTKKDLDFLYERINDLKNKISNETDGKIINRYDQAIMDYMDQAEKIRARVFRFQYEKIRKAVLLTYGKKICTAAVSIFLPFVPMEKRQEVLSRFESMIAPLLGIRGAAESLPGLAPGESDGAEKAQA